VPAAVRRGNAARAGHRAGFAPRAAGIVTSTAAAGRSKGAIRTNRPSVLLRVVGDALAAVPGLGVDVAFLAGPGTPGYRLDWLPDD